MCCNYYLSPFYKASVGSRISRDTASFRGTVIPGIDGFELFSSGIVLGCSLVRGELHASPCAVELLSQGKTDELALCLKAFYSGKSKILPSDIALYACLVENDTETARRSLDTNPDVNAFVNAALLSAVVYEDPARAAFLLNQGQPLATYTDEWLCYARIYEKVLGRRRDALTCMVRAEEAAIDALDLKSCAGAWKGLFADAHQSRQCMVQAESRACDACDLVACAQMHLQLRGDERKAESFMTKADAAAELYYEWLCCAYVWQEDFNAREQASQCIRRAEVSDEVCTVWVEAARAWKDVCNDGAHAVRCLTEAEKSSRDVSDWLSCSAAWMDCCGNRPAARACIEKGEAMAESSCDWKECAESWKEIMADERTIRQCLIKSEDAAKNTSDWCCCAEAWGAFFENSDREVDCLQKAVKASRNTRESIECAAAWMGYGRREAAGCMAAAEQCASAACDWKQCAEAWEKLFKNIPAAESCLRQAKALERDLPF